MFIVNGLIAFANWFWQYPILLLCGIGGIYLGFRLGWVQFRHFGYICGQTFGKMFGKSVKSDEGSVSPFAAACTALASTVGASNIVGVPVAIALGGPGAVLWIILMALVGAGTKYVEVTAGLMYREKNDEGVYVGGPYYYCRKIGDPGTFLGKLGAFFGTFYAFMLMIELVPSLASQATAAAQQGTSMNIPHMVIAVITAVLVVIVCIGGVKRIGDFCDKLVPLMAVIYLIGAIIIIIMHATNVPSAIAAIFTGAFSKQAAVGGFAGATVAQAIRWGTARGVYSNEAGFGTAPQGHAAAQVDHPVRQGFWGVFEVIVDTLIVCITTALVILTTGVYKIEGLESGALTQRAFREGFGAFGDFFVGLCVFLFVLSTIIVCAFYGQRQAEFLFGTKFGKVWIWVYVIATLVGGMGYQLGVLFSLTDAFLAMVIIPNMISLFFLAPKVRKAQDEFFNTPGKYYLADVAAKKERKAAKKKK
jgi:AGCS family alanine or glycine:cation symporter